jgi:hypothetical protein
MSTVIPAEGIILERVLDATWPACDEGLNRQAYARFDAAQMKTAWGRRHLRRFALMDGDNILASATQFTLAGTLDRRSVRICGIGAISTGPMPGNADRAWELIDRLLDEAARDGAELALLFPAHDLEHGLAHSPEHDLEHSEQHGFETIVMPEVEVLVAEPPPRRGAPLSLIRGGEERDRTGNWAMGQARARDVRFHLDRDVDFVQHAITRKRLLAGLGAPGARELHFFIAEEGITAAAYVVISIIGSHWTIEECGDRDPSGARVGAMLQALVAREPIERRPSIRAWLPPAFVPPQVTIVTSAPPTRLLSLKALGATNIRPPLSGDDVLYWRSDAF